jgi:H+/Na+-translocating ferredoxin:NAD+ oxidoreductase subunit D
MSSTPPISHAPHAHSGDKVSRIMLIVMAALAPATLVGFGAFGWPAVWVWLITIAACIVTEVACIHATGRNWKPSIGDGSAILTGWLLALSLPPWAPWWIAVLGAVIAIALGKQVYGGLGQNPFNPAMIARVALLVSFPLEMTQWVATVPMFAAGSPGPLEGLSIIFSGVQNMDAVSSATLLGHVKTEASRGIAVSASLPAIADGLFAGAGLRPGSLGETAAWLIGAGGLALIFLRIITWHIPVAMLAGALVPALIAHGMAPDHYLPAGAHLLSGGLILGAFFIATDLVTSPSTRPGQLIFGLGCGLLTWIIRTWGGYPEGIAFAVVLMNACVPLIDRYTRPRVYGRGRAQASAAK